MKLNLSQGLVATSLVLSLVACGPKLQSVSESKGDSSNNPSDRETVNVGVSFTEKGAGFSLASATSFVMSLDGCASGLTVGSITQGNPGVNVYKFDQGCKVKLSSFVLSGLTYTPTVGDPFTSWAPGDVATFSSGSLEMIVTVTSQLNNPITGTEAVAYSFTQLAAGADESVAESVVGDSHALSVGGIDAATVDVVGVTMNGMTAAGAGQFVFKVECLTNITGTAPALSCGNNLMTTLKYVLVEDTTGGTLTAAQAAALFASAGTTVDAADQLPLGTPGAVKGGFNTQTLTGPNAMHTHRSMLLVIQSGDTSYRYFNVDVSALTN